MKTIERTHIFCIFAQQFNKLQQHEQGLPRQDERGAGTDVSRRCAEHRQPNTLRPSHNIRSYCCIDRMAKPFTNGGTHPALHARGRTTTMSSCGQCRRPHCSRLESSASTIRERRCHLQAQRTSRYATPSVGA